MKVLRKHQSEAVLKAAQRLLRVLRLAQRLQAHSPSSAWHPDTTEIVIAKWEGSLSTTDLVEELRGFRARETSGECEQAEHLWRTGLRLLRL